MASKSFISSAICLVFSVQTILAQSLCGLGAYNGLGYNGLAGAGLTGYNGLAGSGLAGYNGLAGAGLGCGTGVASTGGGLVVSSASPIAPIGVSVVSENVYEGQLSAAGNLPFLGTVALEGSLPSAGSGAVSYGCGDGAVGIGSEGPIATGITVPGAVFPPGSPSSAATADALALTPGLNGNGLGYNGLGGISGYGLGGIAGLGRGSCGCGF